jgi:hypothetical protein
MKTDPPNPATAPSTTANNEPSTVNEGADAVATLLSDLEGKAKAATAGPWEVDEGWHRKWSDGSWHAFIHTTDDVEERGQRFIAWLTGGMGDGDIVERRPELKRSDPQAIADAQYIAAFDPGTCLALMEVARAAQWAERWLVGSFGEAYTPVLTLRAALARLGERSET